MKKLFSILILLSCFCGFIKWTFGRSLIVPRDTIESCTKEYTKSDKYIDATDYHNLDIHLENDTHTFLNGTFTNTLGFEKFAGRIFAEHRIGNTWTVEAFDRKYKDFCKSNYDPLQPSYVYTKDFPPCPVAKDTVYYFNMVPIVFPEHVLEAMPPHFWGEWRATFIFEFTTGGETTINCVRGYGDIYEDTRPRKIGNITKLQNPFKG